MLSGVWLWYSISRSVDGSPRRRLRVGERRPGWVAVAAVGVGRWVGRWAAGRVAGGVLPERRAWVWAGEGWLRGVRTTRCSRRPEGWSGPGVASRWGKRRTSAWIRRKLCRRVSRTGRCCCRWDGLRVRRRDGIRGVREPRRGSCRRRSRLRRFGVELRLTGGVVAGGGSLLAPGRRRRGHWVHVGAGG